MRNLPVLLTYYPPSESFLEYFDQYGIYVEDETAVCFVGSHRTAAYRASGATQNDPGYRDWYLSQLEEMVQNHRNHPSVIIWSIGNENVYGENFVESYKWVKENDPSRPVIYSYPGQVPDSAKIYEKQLDNFTPGEPLNVPVHNRFDHTNFSELRITWKSW